MNKKAAIELSTNFLVIIILSIVVFGMGIYMVNMFFSSSESMKEDINKQTEEQIINLLMAGDRVSIPITKQTISVGKSYTFGVGILNILGDPSDFTIYVEEGPMIASDGTRYDAGEYDSLNYIETRTIEDLANNEHRVVSVPVAVPRGSVSGEYILNVHICASDTCFDPDINDLYDKTVHKIRIEVP